MDIDERLDNLKLPNSTMGQNEPLKLTLMSAKKSAAIGVWLAAVPLFFLGAVVMKYLFHVNLHVIDVFEEVMAHLDKDPSTMWLTPVFFVLLPLAGILLNMLAIIHVEYRKVLHQLVVTIKLKPVNILICCVSLAIVAVVFLHALTDH